LSGRARAAALTLLSAAALAAACVEVPTGASDILSIQFNPLPAPGVVIGDSLRDTLGIARGVTVTAFNFSGNVVENPQVVFSTADRGIRVDSVTGIVIGDSVRSNARILAKAGGLTIATPVAVILRPDSVAGSNARDSLSYSATDTANISPTISVKVLHVTAIDTTGVPSYLVSFQVAGDTALAKPVSENGARSSLDTTDASGIAGRRIRLDVTKLTSLVDSVIVQAFVRYKGVNLRGSPVRLVLKVKPK
jgi:hypothetical protein